MEPLADKASAQRETSVELVGPYVLLAEIARGDLTQVFLAKKHGALGFQRLCALKRLKPEWSTNTDYAELLFDEARLIAGIHHANIAGVLDVGNEPVSFVVTEYIEGDNLENLLSRAGETRSPRYFVPAFVDALNGLQALHTATDDEGASCGIVHQAPRARHILVGIDGTARLIDFTQMRGKGVRPTRARSDRLKVGYMAPEQALHPDGVDHRADLFICGISLWEALTGERLFAADTDELTFQNMLHRRIPRPSEVGLRPPAGFDAVCMRALERDPKNRYASAQEMARDLRDAAVAQGLYATATELGHWARQLSRDELRERRRLSGQDLPSSNETRLEGAPLGVDTTARTEPPAKPSEGSTPRGALDDNPYATGRIHGGSHARVALDEAPDSDKTPALGNRRPEPLPRTDDDAPTALRPNLAAAQPEQDARARAITWPGGSAAAQDMPSGETDTEGRERDEEATQPTRFVPARPGSKRDQQVSSPGAYSQVDASRRAKRVRDSAPDEAVRSASFDEADTRVRQTHGPDERGSSKPPRRFGAGTFPERRTGPITEHPPTYVQRRDSQPTRMEIPDGPVGTPHRSIAAASNEPSATTSEAMIASAVRDSSVANWPDAGPALSMPDSLTPPLSPAHSNHPDVPSRERPTWMWLLSGVAAALLLLGLGIGFAQWVAWEEPHRTQRHTASGRPDVPSAERRETEQRAAPVEPSEPARALGEPKTEAPAQEPGELAEGGTSAALKSARERSVKDPAPRSTSPAPRRVAPRANPKVALPDNPY